MIDHLLKNPYYRPEAIVCKLIVNFATYFWSMLILSKIDAFGPTAYNKISMFVQEDLVAGFLLSISVAQMVWLESWAKPLRNGAVGYLIQCAWWVGVFTLIVTDRGPMQPTALMGVGTIALVGVFAFVATPTSYGNPTG